MKVIHYAIIQLHVHDLNEATLPIADIDSDVQYTTVNNLTV